MKPVFTEQVPFLLIPENIPASSPSGDPTNLLEISSYQVSKAFGPFPFRFARNHIDRLNPHVNPNLVPYTDMLLAQNTSGPRDFNELLFAYLNPSSFSGHLTTVSYSTLFVYRQLADYRRHAYQWMETWDYDPDVYYNEGDPRRFVFTHEFGRMCEVFMYDTLRYYLNRRNSPHKLSQSYWLVDWLLGVDGFMDHIPFDFTTLQPASSHESLQHFLTKLENVGNNGIAVLGIETWFQSSTMALMRRMLLDKRVKGDGRRKIEGLVGLPNYIFEENIRFIETAVNELCVKTALDFRPFLHPYPRTLAATDYILDILLTNKSKVSLNWEKIKTSTTR